jgi:hypothetical protein
MGLKTEIQKAFERRGRRDFAEDAENTETSILNSSAFSA